MDKKIGLLATARKKSRTAEPVITFYQSPLFRKSVQYALKQYEHIYFYNAKDGLLMPEQIMEPYDVSIKTFSLPEKKRWAHDVIQTLNKYESPGKAKIFLHGGLVYRKFLEPELKNFGFAYVVPLKGLGIGEQLVWYDKHLSDE